MFEHAFKLIGASNVNTIFGSPITPPNSALTDPVSGLSRIIVVGLQIFFSVAGIAVLIYLLWGAFDWITSGGDSDKVAAAQSKMTNAVIGIIMVIVALTIFSVVVGDILGIVKRDSNGSWIFKLPTLNDNCTSAGCTCTTSGTACDTGLSCIPRLDGSGTLSCQ